jgi:hypothetical protein
MTEHYLTKLTISIDYSGGDSLDDTGPIKTMIETDMTDCSVHAWYKVFEQVLHLAGFQDRVIMSGAAQLAFNEMRDIKDMRATAKFYDLKLLEDVDDMPTPVDTPQP